MNNKRGAFIKRYGVLFFVLLFFAGCFSAQLKEGKTVEHVTKQEAPSNCEKINEVSLNMMKIEFAVTSDGIITQLRNKAGKIGDNFLVVDVIEKHYNNGSYTYTGFGRAYRCR